MKLTIIGAAMECKALKEFLKQRICSGWELCCNVWLGRMEHVFLKQISSFHPDLLITLNLAGFELTTQRKGIFYNLLDCKCLHLLTEKNLENEACLAKQLSLSMFFYCVGEAYGAYLKRTYPDIPYLRAVRKPGQTMSEAQQIVRKPGQSMSKAQQIVRKPGQAMSKAQQIVSNPGQTMPEAQRFMSNPAQVIPEAEGPVWEDILTGIFADFEKETGLSFLKPSARSGNPYTL